MHKNTLVNASRQQKVEAVAEAMIRLEPNATAENIKNLTGITQPDLDKVADDARALAMSRSERVTRARIPSRRAA
ncbi:hypothetical protein ACLJYM_14570 [Rhizobium giardinii]|uniref:hypothetical protein n=1 Tax=Rhizobium giardinii TaxID=56731 RepID=UPI0039DF55BD